jgi:hypothetical protein
MNRVYFKDLGYDLKKSRKSHAKTVFIWVVDLEFSASMK